SACARGRSAGRRGGCRPRAPWPVSPWPRPPARRGAPWPPRWHCPDRRGPPPPCRRRRPWQPGRSRPRPRRSPPGIGHCFGRGALGRVGRCPGEVVGHGGVAVEAVEGEVRPHVAEEVLLAPAAEHGMGDESGIGVVAGGE